MVQTAPDYDIPPTAVLGEVSVQYPIVLSPGGSSDVILRIYIPAQYARYAPRMRPAGR